MVFKQFSGLRFKLDDVKPQLRTHQRVLKHMTAQTIPRVVFCTHLSALTRSISLASCPSRSGTQVYFSCSKMLFPIIKSSFLFSATATLITGFFNPVSAGNNRDGTQCSGTLYGNWNGKIPSDYLGPNDSKGIYIHGMDDALTKHVHFQYRDIDIEVWVDRTNSGSQTFYNYHLAFSSAEGLVFDHVDLALFNSPQSNRPFYVMRIPMNGSPSGENCFSDNYNWLPPKNKPDTPAFFVKLPEN